MGGFGPYEDIIAGYEATSGRKVDREKLRWWQIMGTARWAAICLMQGATHWQGHRRSVGARGDGTAGRRGRVRPDAAAAQGVTMSVPYDRPDALELIDAVGDFLAEQVMGAVDGQLAFHVRVAANALRIAGRELRAAPESAGRPRGAPGPLRVRGRSRARRCHPLRSA